MLTKATSQSVWAWVPTLPYLPAKPQKALAYASAVPFVPDPCWFLPCSLHPWSMLCFQLSGACEYNVFFLHHSPLHISVSFSIQLKQITGIFGTAGCALLQEFLRTPDFLVGSFPGCRVGDKGFCHKNAKCGPTHLAFNYTSETSLDLGRELTETSTSVAPPVKIMQKAPALSLSLGCMWGQ